LIKDENIEFAKYLKERVLSIEIFDSDSLMHFGTAKIPMFKLLRQGKPVVAKGIDSEICESQFGNHVGTL